MAVRLRRTPFRLLATVAVVCAFTATAAAVATPAQARSSGAPAEGTAPEIKGKARDGAKLRALAGSWTGTRPIAHAFAWERCDAAGAECEPIPGASTNKYRATPADVGHRLVVAVTASNAEGSATARSAPSAVVAALAPKHKGRAPTAGEALDGRVLSVGTGAWKGTPSFTYSYQWIRCGKGCVQIAGATQPSYRVTTEDIGRTLKAVITATNAAGSGTQRSLSTAKVLPGSPLDLSPPRVSGTPLVGQTLTAEDGEWVGTPPIAFGYQWYACSSSGCEAIAGATEQTHAVGVGEIGDSFEVEVTAGNAQGSAAATSEPTNLVGGDAPVNTEAPGVSGTATAGQLLTASSGKWSGTEPIAFEYEWLRCNTSGAECTQASAPSLLATYLAAGADVGHTLRAKVIAKNIAGSASAESSPSEPVKGVPPANLVLPVTVPVGTTTSGSTVTATEGTWTGTQPIAYAYEWRLCTSATSCKVEQKGSSNSFKVPSGSGGNKLRVDVIATNAAGSGEKEALELTVLI